MENRNLTLWNDCSPFRKFDSLHRQINRLLGDFRLPTTSMEWRDDNRLCAPCNVEETGSHYVFSFDLPGVSKDGIHVDLQDNRLTVSGERKQERENKEAGETIKERSYGKFQRAFTLPNTVDVDVIVLHIMEIKEAPFWLTEVTFNQGGSDVDRAGIQASSASRGTGLFG